MALDSRQLEALTRASRDDLDIAERIARLEDLEAIRNLKSLYVGYCDPYDPEGFASVFAPDGVWQGGDYGEYRGYEALRDFIANDVRDDYVWTFHYLLRPLIELSDDRQTATGEFYAHIYEVLHDDTAPHGQRSVVAFARYFDEFVKIDGQWRIAHVRAETSRLHRMNNDWIIP
ncbi:nuclear transport factor 2 family protein [Microbacterium sp. Mu-80]|uniref:Nuclear transport factor 2 family protein n=1 Tax=Microbacterium bandirmense TaxID=3122050 RepID=A0ABU8LFK6_9MICO